MAFAVLLWRTRRAVASVFERRGVGLVHRVEPPAGDAGPAWTPVMPVGFPADRYTAPAERILAGHRDIFALHDCALGFPPRWNRDPKTGIEVALAYGKAIDYRDERAVGDIKYLWELNRHLELVTLAQAWHLTHERRYAEGARALLLSWFEQCPYPLGPNWTSALEVAVRLLNWACAWHLLGGETSPLFAGADGDSFRRGWLRAIHQHCHFIAHNLSRHSSANNHLFGELTGLLVGSVTWPLWPESARWREQSRRELEREAIRQNGADGTNREQALWYQHEVADMMLLCLLFARSAGLAFSRSFGRRLESMLEFVAAVMDAGGHVPMLGDADDGLIVRFSREPDFRPFQSLLATGAVLFGRGNFKAGAGRFDDKSRWLLGDQAERRFHALPALAPWPCKRVFPDGGYYVLGQNFGSRREVKAVVDAGPLGYLSIAAHGHADALSFTLSICGHEILVDPGTYAYHRERRWRDYFRGTAAHNTLRVDGTEQSVSGGSFLWTSHARARCERFESGTERDLFEGVHDGYLRLPDPVLHRRRIEFDKQAARFEIHDTLECAAPHEVELHWHLAEHCRALVSGYTVEISRASERLRLECPRELAPPEVVSGREEPPLGWISRRLDEKSPAPTIVCRGRIASAASLRTVLAIDPPADRAGWSNRTSSRRAPALPASTGPLTLGSGSR
jgi:hypothetical protein